MSDPFAPPAPFPADRLLRAGLDPDTVEDYRTRWDEQPPEGRTRFSRLVASVADADLTDGDGGPGPVIAGWPDAAASEGERQPTEQEQAQADGPLVVPGTEQFDPGTLTIPEVEAYLDGLSGDAAAAEVDRVEAAEKAGKNRVGVAAAISDTRERLAED